MEQKILRLINREYYRTTLLEKIYYACSLIKEKIFGVDSSIFDKAIIYYKEVKGEDITRGEALSIALNKNEYKESWFAKERKTIKDIMDFYGEVNFYIFRTSFNRRMGGIIWYRRIVKHKKNPAILEYGCAAAILTEKIMERFPNCNYTVADIPSASLDFVKWKKEKFNYNYNILTIGEGKEGIPLSKEYDLIICQTVLEHTSNPLEIVTAFVEHLSVGGVLIIDFLDAQGGENLEIAVSQKEDVKRFLKNNLIALKAIDEPEGCNGLYLKDACFGGGASLQQSRNA